MEVVVVVVRRWRQRQPIITCASFFSTCPFLSSACGASSSRRTSGRWISLSEYLSIPSAFAFDVDHFDAAHVIGAQSSGQSESSRLAP